MPSTLRVSIVGAGASGFALAADLIKREIGVLIYTHVGHCRHADKVKRKGRLDASGVIEGLFDIRITTDIREAATFSSFIIFTVPSTGQETILAELKGIDLRRHTIIAVPGNLFSLIAEAQIEAEFILETNLAAHASRMNEAGVVVLGKKRVLSIAALEERRLSQALRDTVGTIFDAGFKWCRNVMEVCLSNPNGVIHPLVVLMNAGHIESMEGELFIYLDGLTESVANAILALDDMRLKIGEAFGLPLQPLVEMLSELYGQVFTSLLDWARNSEAHRKIKAPSSLRHRMIVEDVPDVLVCWHGLAKKLGIDSSPARNVIGLAEMATRNNFMETGRNLQKLRLDGVPRTQLIARFGVASV